MNIFSVPYCCKACDFRVDSKSAGHKQTDNIEISCKLQLRLPVRKHSCKRQKVSVVAYTDFISLYDTQIILNYLKYQHTVVYKLRRLPIFSTIWRVLKTRALA
jgi:hypothetical protein